MKGICILKHLAITFVLLSLMACDVSELVDATPVAKLDSATTVQDSVILINVLANDTGLGDTPLSITISGDADNGATEVLDNNIRYTPNTDFFGTDSFEYTVTDKDGDSASAIVAVTITAVANAIPVAMNDRRKHPARYPGHHRCAGQ